MKINLTSSLFFCLLFVLVLPACNTAKSAKGKKIKERPSAYILEKVNANKKQADWFTTKALISYKDDYQGIKITSLIGIKKDSLIWMNLKKLGFEAARIKITPDSIHILDRINKQYTSKSFDYITQQFKLPNAISQTLDFKALQNFFIGNPVFIPVKTMKAAAELDGRYKLHGEYDDVAGKYYFDGRDYELLQSTFVDSHTQKNLSLNYSNYQMIEGHGNYSFFRTIDLSSVETGAVRMTIELSKIEIDIPKNLKFAIPPTYTKKN